MFQIGWGWNLVGVSAILKVWRQIENPTPSVDAYLLEEQSCQISSRSNFKWHRVLGFFREITYGRHLESVTSYIKSDSVSRCVFTWRTILPNFIPIRFETTELFWVQSPEQEQEQDEQWQSDHLSGKPENVREFETCQGNVRDNVNSQGIVREESGKNYCQGKLARLGGQMKKLSRLANARHNSPWTNQLIFTVTLLRTVHRNIYT